MIMYDGHLLYRLLSSGEYFKRRVNVSCVKKLPIKKMSGNSFKKKNPVAAWKTRAKVPGRHDKYLRLPSHYNIIHYMIVCTRHNNILYGDHSHHCH